MTLAKPVIASSTGGSAELVVHGTTGYLFEADNIDLLAEQIEHYSQRRELIASHGSAGETRAQNLMSEEFSNAAAIERLKRTAVEPAYQLPHMARFWFGLPGQYFSVRRAPQITIGFALNRLSARARGILMRPINAIRRLQF
jgi:glycosyltransferase involved in cell wall biosynthesis